MTGHIINNYVIERKLGEGGMGEVYFARHNRIDRIVAIKTLRKSLFDNAAIRHRFKNEANALIKLVHPNIVKIYDYVEQDNIACLIMEYIDGYTLDDYLNKVSGPLPEAKAISIICSVLDAVQYAHENNIYHRDIKPGNIMVSKDGRLVRIMDFSIAKFTDGSSFKTTHANAQLGTPFYMSPEQVKGLPYTSLSDIYSIGVTLYEMVTGKCPYCEITNLFELQSKIVNEPLPPTAKYNAAVPVVIQDAIKIATGKSPENRFQSCNAFKNYLLKPETKQEVSGRQGAQQTVMSRGTQQEIVRPAIVPPKQTGYNNTNEKVTAAVLQPNNNDHKILWWPYLTGGGTILLFVIIYALTKGTGTPEGTGTSISPPPLPTTAEVMKDVSGKVINNGILVNLPDEAEEIKLDTLTNDGQDYWIELKFKSLDNTQDCVDTVFYNKKNNQYVYDGNRCNCVDKRPSPSHPTFSNLMNSLNHTVTYNGSTIPLWNVHLKDTNFNPGQQNGQFSFTFKAVGTGRTCTVTANYENNGTEYIYNGNNCDCTAPTLPPPTTAQILDDLETKVNCDGVTFSRDEITYGPTPSSGNNAYYETLNIKSKSSGKKYEVRMTYTAIQGRYVFSTDDYKIVDPEPPPPTKQQVSNDVKNKINSTEVVFFPENENDLHFDIPFKNAQKCTVTLSFILPNTTRLCLLKANYNNIQGKFVYGGNNCKCDPIKDTVVKGYPSDAQVITDLKAALKAGAYQKFNISAAHAEKMFAPDVINKESLNRGFNLVITVSFSVQGKQCKGKMVYNKQGEGYNFKTVNEL